MSSDKEAALGLPQLSLKFLADSNSWNVNGTPIFGTVRQLLKNIERELSSDKVLAQPSVLFSVELLKNKFKYQVFYFQFYDILVEKNIIYQPPQKMLGRRFVT